mgnify:CR=1 FL=1
MDRSLVRELAAECLGTFILIAFGAASVAQMVLSHHTLGEPQAIRRAERLLEPGLKLRLVRLVVLVCRYSSASLLV